MYPLYTIADNSSLQHFLNYATPKWGRTCEHQTFWRFVTSGRYLMSEIHISYPWLYIPCVGWKCAKNTTTPLLFSSWSEFKNTTIRWSNFRWVLTWTRCSFHHVTYFCICQFNYKVKYIDMDFLLLIRVWKSYHVMDLIFKDFLGYDIYNIV